MAAKQFGYEADGTTRAEVEIAEQIKKLCLLDVSHIGIEWPPHLRIVFLDGRVAHLGTVNGPWSADVYASYKTECDTDPAEVWDVPESHAQTAEGIARYIIGRAVHSYGLTAYASQAEQDKADRDERRARNGR